MKDAGAISALWRPLQRVELRATLHVVSFCALVFFLLPALLSEIFGESSWMWMSPDRSWRTTLVLQVAAVLGLSAVQEFACRGRGTPFPYDPPRRLVVSGPYAYVANPMQVCKVSCLLFWGFFLGSGWVVFVGAVYLILTAIWTAPWEDRKLERRFGESFRSYRAKVSRWWPRWKPHRAVPGRLWVAETCGPCRGVGRWVRSRKPVGLEILAAESHPHRVLTRITYESGGYEDEGVAAFARALEHLDLGWAFLGWMLRLPGVRPLCQLVLDATGGVSGDRAPAIEFEERTEKRRTA